MVVGMGQVMRTVAPVMRMVRLRMMRRMVVRMRKRMMRMGMRIRLRIRMRPVDVMMTMAILNSMVRVRLVVGVGWVEWRRSSV